MEFLQLHYFLKDELHSVDAFINNKAEYELLRIFKEVTSILELEGELQFETIAIEEGGIKAFYKLISKKKNKRKIKNALLYLAGILSVIISDVVSDQIKTDHEYEKLKKEEIRLRIEKLKRDLEDEETTEQDKTLIIQNLSVFIAETNKVKLFKSNFYSTLLKEEKIEQVSTQRLNENLEPITNENIVPRKDFDKFILHSVDIDPDFRESEIIEIVSPVLKKGNMKWKGIYNEKPISFYMRDGEFLTSVINKEISFSNGTSIIADIEFEQKMNDDGEIEIGTISIFNVTDVFEDSKRIETKRKKRNRELRNQTKMDFDNETE
ncbi:hypothetical protein [Tenacibaculum sp. IB213877]|uniref:hypothetical protein n=1 Tax=Tenacibaculum sp. IB213877 TaxID=3097351 RepID=UPI002A5A4723|nr:hypothetical protein [Tenacibaculum sp. IB213877]MDY0781678.1 hypothetical protein [Tenacibaculum sp. IB213877]